MSAHTPGPWNPGRALFGGQEAIIGDGDSVVCLMPDKTIGCTFKREDAWLIATAPKLLAFADKVARNFSDAEHHGSVESSLRDTALALVAEATGARP